MPIYKQDNSNTGISRTLKPSTTLGVTRRLSFHIGNLQGFGARERQEDSFAFVNAFDVKEIQKNGMLFAVFDGMGGMKDGRIASEKASACIRESFEQMNRNEDMAVQLKDSILRASEQIEAILEGEGGSTVVAGIIYQDMLYYASVGDSYLYLKRDTHLYRLNRENNICNQIYSECISDGDMNPQRGRYDPEASALTAFLGMPGLEDIDGSVRPMPLKVGDVILACSDGVGGVLNENEIYQALCSNTPKGICDLLEQGIITHNNINQDNYTALVVKCLI